MEGEVNSAKHEANGKKKSKNPRKMHPNMAGGHLPKQRGPKNNNHRNPRKGRFNSAKESSKNLPQIPHKYVTTPKFVEHNDPSKHVPTLRKMVDPETAKYFSEIANLFESNVVDLEERSAICGSAIEETRGKEAELATDMIISRTLQCLLEGCDLDQLCGFLQNCSKGFPSIAMDKFGSHVAETALKTLAIHLQHEGSYPIIEETLTKICHVVVVDAVNVMCSRYGSHVLRSLLCLCKGVPLDSLEEFHVTKPSTILAERLNFKLTQSCGNNPKTYQHGFPVLFMFLVKEMFNHAKDEITTLRVNKYSSFVFQTALKLLSRDCEELLQTSLILLGCHEKNIAERKFIETERKQDIIALIEDTSSSHLLEVIIEVAPESLYSELLTEVFKGSLYNISSHHCGNFVVQALVSSARTTDQVEMIWMELGLKLKELLEAGKSGVIASVLAVCQRLQTCLLECCQSLAAAVSSESESSCCIVPHMLFLESYIREKSCWKWPISDRMQILGCLMLQIIFRCPIDLIQPYVTSIASMEADRIFQTAKDAGGNHVVEAFLCSAASAKQKLKVITKLQDNFGELSMHPSSSFTVEKCFTASNMPLKEAIAAELLAAQAELSKTKHGPYLLKKLDIDGFARDHERWKQSLASKEAAYNEFQTAFGSEEQLQEGNVGVATSSRKTRNRRPKRYEKMSDEINRGARVYNPKEAQLSVSERSYSSGSNIKVDDSNRFIGKDKDTPFLRKSGKRKSSADELYAKDTSFVRKSGKRSSAYKLADLAGKRNLSVGDVCKLFRPTKGESKQSGSERSFMKKQNMW